MPSRADLLPSSSFQDEEQNDSGSFKFTQNAQILWSEWTPFVLRILREPIIPSIHPRPEREGWGGSDWENV